jgi:hypothetical protein
MEILTFAENWKEIRVAYIMSKCNYYVITFYSYDHTLNFNR